MTAMNTRSWCLLALLALFTVPALAQLSPRQVLRDDTTEVEGGWSGSSSYESGEYMDNPCTATSDWVWVSYAASVYYDGWQTDSGEEPVLFDESTTLSGGTYAASGTSQSEVAAYQTYSLRQYHKVNTPDDFHVVTVITFDPGTRQSTISRETACGNGTPDSIE